MNPKIPIGNVTKGPKPSVPAKVSGTKTISNNGHLTKGKGYTNAAINNTTREKEALGEKIENTKAKNRRDSINQQRKQKSSNEPTPEEKENIVKTLKEKAEEEALKETLHTAMLAAGVPEPIALIVLQSEVFEDLANEYIKTYKRVRTIQWGLILLGCFLLFAFVLGVVISQTEDDVADIERNTEINSTINNYVRSDNMEFSEAVPTLIYYGYCRDYGNEAKNTEECLKQPIGKYYYALNEVYKYYYENYTDVNGNPFSLDMNLLMGAISYDRSMDEIAGIIEDKNAEKPILPSGTVEEAYLTGEKSELTDFALAMVEEVTEYGDVFIGDGSFCRTENDTDYKTYYRISDEKFQSFIKYGETEHENYSGLARRYDVDVHPMSNEACIPEGRSYNPPENTSLVGNINGNIILEEAKKYVGVIPYVWGGESLETGADCSGFIWAILTKLGLYDGDRFTTKSAYNTLGQPVISLNYAKAGDIIFYGPDAAGVHHVAIYDGNGMIVEAKSTNTGITYDRTADHENIVSIRRVASEYSGTAGHDTVETAYADNIKEAIVSTVYYEARRSYEGELAVISSMMNRVDVNYNNYGADLYSQLTMSGQYSGYARYLQEGKPTNSEAYLETEKAVDDCLYNGIRNTSFTSFKAYKNCSEAELNSSGWQYCSVQNFAIGEEIDGNWFHA